jgi:hypothetical protein
MKYSSIILCFVWVCLSRKKTSKSAEIATSDIYIGPGSLTKGLGLQQLIASTLAWVVVSTTFQIRKVYGRYVIFTDGVGGDAQI